LEVGELQPTTLPQTSTANTSNAISFFTETILSS
jgi:hypothetical protein